MSRILFAVILAAVLLVVWVPTRYLALARTSQPSASSLALRASDLPGGFKQLSSTALPNSSFAHIVGRSSAAVTSVGRRSGAWRLFGRDNAVGLMRVMNEVDLYRSKQGAEKGFWWHVWSLKRGQPTTHHFRTFTFPGLGDQYQAWAFEARQGNQETTEAFIVIQRRTATVVIDAAADSTTAALDVAPIERLARTADARADGLLP